MKTIMVKIQEELHRQLKIDAINTGKTMTDIVTELITQYLETKKEQTH